MFAIFRSVFWLTAAYMVIKPGVDLPDANALSQQAMAAGSQVIAQQIDTIDCTSLECIGGKAIAVHTLSSLSPQLAPPAAPEALAPLPRPRPDRAS